MCIRDSLYKELQLDIFWRTRTWNLSLSYNLEELFRYMVISRALHPNCTWNEALEKGIYFEESGSISDEDLDSAFHVIVKLQKDLQKWIYEHSGSILSRDTTSAFLDHTSYNFSIPGSMPSDTQPNARRTDSTLHLDPVSYTHLFGVSVKWNWLPVAAFPLTVFSASIFAVVPSAL